MTEFVIQTEETWNHAVEYTVQADSVDDAVKDIVAGNVSYDKAEVIEAGDKVLKVCSVDGVALLEAESIRLIAEGEKKRRPDEEQSGVNPP